MAVNDLMMKIQLLVESGKSSTELNRLQQALKTLQNQLTSLDRTQLTPLTRDLESVKRAAAQLKTVNLGNFASQIEAVKKSFTGLGLSTSNLDQLKTAYQKLNAQLASGDLQRYQVQLKAVSDRLREAKAFTLTDQTQSRNTTYGQLNRDVGRYNSAILTATQSIVSQQQEILGLKNQLSQLPKIKIDPTVSTTIQELRRWANASGRGIRVTDVQKSFASMQDFNTELAKQQGLYNQSRLNAQKYQETLAKLRIEGQRLAIPDLTVGGTRNLIRELEQAKTKVADLSRNGIIPLQNEIRKLQARSSFNKAFNIDPLKASVKVARAELAQLSLDAQKTRSMGGTVSIADESRMAALKQQIVDSNKKIADLELKAQQTTARGIAHANQRLAIKQNELALDKASFQNIQSLIASQKQSAQLASQSVKTRTGGTFDTAAAKAAAQAEANLYKNNLASLKQYLSERKTAATEDANLLKQQIQGAQQRLSQQQLTKAQWSAERAEIQATLAAEKARSQVYQQTLRDQQRSVKDAIQSEKERESSLRTQIRTLTQLGTAQAQVKAIQLQSDLSSAKNRQGDLRNQSREIEQAAKAELQRIQALDQSTKAMGRQSGAVSSLGRLFKESGGPAKEFFAAMRFALGPQMAGFKAASSISNLVSGFVDANKSVENLIRGLNAISGGQGAAEFEQLVSTANRLGVSIQEAAHSFLQLKASAEGTGLEGEKIQKIFASFSNALNVTGADTVTMNRAFRSISQMISKGQLYAEELKGQLAEALPGAIQVFARALDVTPKKLMALIKSGEIEGRNLERVLALVAVELDKTYKVANEQDFTFTQKAALAQNALTELFITVGNTGVWKALGNALLSVRTLLQDLTQNIPALGDTLKTEFGLVSDLILNDLQTMDQVFPSIRQSITEVFSHIAPEVDFSKLKQQILELPSTIRLSLLPSLQSFSEFFLELETMFKNFRAKQQAEPGIQLFSSTDPQGNPLDAIDPQSWIDQTTQDLADYARRGFSDAWSYLKELTNTPIEVKAEIVPLNREAFVQQQMSGYLNPPDVLIDSRYGRYLKQIELANQKIREQNGLSEQINQQLIKNNQELDKSHQVLSSNVQQYEQSVKAILQASEARKQQLQDERELKASLDASDRLTLNSQTSYLALKERESTLQQANTSLSKERIRVEKELLDIQQAYQDNLLDLNSKKYQRWADQGSMTQEGAKFLIESAKADQLRKAWTLAQDKVEQYNQELNKGDQANADQLKNLSQLAQDQLKYAESKAKEVGDEYKLKQIMEARVELLKSLQKSGIEKILTEAELKLKTQGFPEAKLQIDQLVEYGAQSPIVMRILPKSLPKESSSSQTVPVTFTLPDTANTIQADWQSLLQSLPTPGFLTCPIEVDDTQVVPTVSQTLSDVQNLFGAQSFHFDTTQPIQSLDQLKYAFVSTQAQIVSASQTAQQNPITYTIKAGNPDEQQKIEDRVKLLQQNPKITTTLDWVTTGGETVDGFTKGLQKQAVVSIVAKANPAQAATEGAKVGQVAATAANQAAAQNPLKLTTDSSNYDLFSGFDASKLNQGIQSAMNQAQNTVKTSVAQMNQELLTKLGTQGVQVNIETVMDQTSIEGWQRQVQRLSAQDHRVSLRVDSAPLDQEFRRIDGQFAEFNRTAGQGLSAGFVSASQQANNFGLLVDQVNQKMRAIQKPDALPPVKPVIEPVVETKTAYQQVQEQLNQANPITISANAAPMVGDIQKELDALRTSGATNIRVTLDEKTGQLVITANTDPANEAVQALVQQIESRDTVLHVRVVYNDPGAGVGSSTVSGEKKRWGGSISGYGGGDRVRALLEPGEFVLRKEAVKALGLSSLMKLNRQGFNAHIPKPSARTIDRVSIPHFAQGGLVTGQPIVINVPGNKSIQVQGSRDSAMQLANLLTRVGRAV